LVLIVSLDKSVILENIPFTIEEHSVLKEMRVARAKSLGDLEERPLREAITKAMDLAYTLIHGKGIYRTFTITGATEDLVQAKGAEGLFTGRNMLKLLADCKYATLMATTIGPDLEDEVERLSGEGDLTGSYALEMVGGLMADYMAERVDERIEIEIKRAGFVKTMRFSPGYGDWPLGKQPQILELCGAEKIGIHLTDTNIMLPRKSVSAVIGWRQL
jgi:hypothetical protein